MFHGDGEVLFNAATADSHDFSHLGLWMTFQPVEPQRALCSRWQSGDDPVEHLCFLLPRKLIVGGWRRVGPLLRQGRAAAILVQPPVVAPHRALAGPAKVEHEVVCHAKEIGAPVTDRSARSAGNLEPHVLKQVLRKIGIAAASRQKAQQLLAMVLEQGGKAGRAALVFFVSPHTLSRSGFLRCTGQQAIHRPGDGVFLH